MACTADALREYGATLGGRGTTVASLDKEGWLLDAPTKPGTEGAAWCTNTIPGDRSHYVQVRQDATLRCTQVPLKHHIHMYSILCQVPGPGKPKFPTQHISAPLIQ